MRRISLVLMFLSLATAQSPSTNSYAEGSDTAAVRRQMLALRSAELQYDVSSAAKLLADGFLLSGADGNLYPEATVNARHPSPQIP